MVSSSFSSFVFVLVFILYQSSADMHQATEKIDHDAAVGKQDVFDGVPTPGEASNCNLNVGGRKMIKRRLLMSEIMKGKDNTEFDIKVESSAVKHQHVKRDDLSSFVPLNADYHPPKSHPPKNN